MKKQSLSRLLRQPQKKRSETDQILEKEMQGLQLEMLRIQQGVWHGKSRTILVFEGFDAAGKGGAIRALTKGFDPRGVRVHPIGPPAAEEQGRHWLYRFWMALPQPGTIAVFDRSWYGRVLVERVEGLTPKKRWQEAYGEILEFERMLERDGVRILKFFLAVSKEEQLRRFRERLHDPYKQWKITDADIQARRHWDFYVQAVDDMLEETDKKGSPWHIIPSDHKPQARADILRIVTKEWRHFGKWMEHKAARLGRRSLQQELQELGKKARDLL